jgi:galactokinase
MTNLEFHFKRIFERRAQFYFDTGGRFELLGNHTDHNHGLCLVANSSLRIKAAVSLNRDKIRIQSKGYKYFEFDVDDLIYDPNDFPATKSICKGILSRFKELGYKIGGFDAYITSDIPDGSGVSSSAAVESLFGYIISILYNEGKVEPIEIAKIGQYSENNYFKKPSGLLDQVGTSFANSNYIDFKNIEKPYIVNLPFKMPLDIYLIKSEGNHSSLTNLYAEIPASMKKVAYLLEGKEFLRDCSEVDIFNRIEKVNATDKEKRIAKHFFLENYNVVKAEQAIRENNVDAFLECVRASQKSSKENLNNTFVEGEFENSPQDIIDKVTEYLGYNGAVRIHGGGFKGTVIVFVKRKYSPDFLKYLTQNYEKGRYFKVEISNKAVNFKIYSR